MDRPAKPFTERTANEMGVELLRWICVLPAAMLGSFVGNVIGAILVRVAVSVGLIHPPSDMSFSNTCARYLIWLFPQGAACVIAGAKMAPRSCLAVACVVGVLWSLLTDWIHRWADYTVIPTAVTAASGTAIVFYSERLKRRRVSQNR